MLEGTYVLWSEYLDYNYIMCKKQIIHDDAPDNLYGTVQLVQWAQGFWFYERWLLFMCSAIKH